MDKDKIDSVATFSVMQYLLNIVMENVELRRDIVDAKTQQETVCFNTLVDTFGGKPA